MESRLRGNDAGGGGHAPVMGAPRLLPLVAMLVLVVLLIYYLN